MANRKPKVKKPDWADKRAKTIAGYCVDEQCMKSGTGMIARALRAAYKRGFVDGFAVRPNRLKGVTDGK